MRRCDLQPRVLAGWSDRGRSGPYIPALTGCYVLLYVPVVIGRPIRFIVSFFRRSILTVIRNFLRRRQPPQRPGMRQRDLIELLALVLVLIDLCGQLHGVSGCQQVDVFSHSSTVCTRKNGYERCAVRLSEVLKISPFKREACFRLSKNGTRLQEVRVTWMSMQLSCEAQSDFFTRHTSYRVIDSKRCAHTGSCVGEKCAAVNSSTLIPELEEGNKYPGNTACVESCGGPGCDCFFLS